jgi:hypothetical protein
MNAARAARECARRATHGAARRCPLSGRPHDPLRGPRAARAGASGGLGRFFRPGARFAYHAETASKNETIFLPGSKNCPDRAKIMTEK